MSFSQELQDFATSFQKTYALARPTEAERKHAEELGSKFAGTGGSQGSINAGRAPSIGTAWAQGDTPGSTATPGTEGAPAAEGGTTTEGGSYNPQGTVPTFAQSSSGPYDFKAAEKAIVGNESGGRFDAVGPVTASGDRAYGYTQVMGKNIPEWTREALGVAMTPQQYLANPEAQKAVFRHRFGGYLSKYGPEGAAAAWFSGSPTINKLKSDVLGTTVPKYVRNFMAQYERNRRRGETAAGGGLIGDDEVRGRPAALPIQAAPQGAAGFAAAPAWGAGGRPANDPTWGGAQPHTGYGAMPTWGGGMPPMALPMQSALTYNPWGLHRPTMFAAEGGMVDELETVPLPPVRPPELGGASEQDYDPTPLANPDGMGNIISEGIDYITQTLGLNNAAVPGADPRSQDGIRAFAANVGAAKPEQVQQIHDTVDPKARLAPAQRQIAGYKAIYEYWMARDEPEKAKRAIAAMAMAAKDAAQVYGTVALRAAREGKTEIAADAIAKAYEQVPDGNTIKVTGTDGKSARFEVLDINGNVTDKGRIAIDEMVRVATGMADGSEWLRTMGAISTRTDKAGAAIERRRAALEEFDRTREPDEKDFISTLTPEAREKYHKLDPRDQRDLRKAHWQKVESERKQENIEYNQISRELQNMQRQENRDLAREDQLQRHLDSMDFKEHESLKKDKRFDTRMNVQTGQYEAKRADAFGRWIVARDDRLEKQAHDDRIKAFDMARKQGNWDDQRERLMSQFERSLAEKQREEDNRNARLDQSLEARRKRNEENDRRILEDRKVRKDARAAAAAERAARPARMTAEERKQQAVDTSANAALVSAREQASQTTDPYDIANTNATFAEAEGTVGADRTYRAAEAARKGQPAVGDAEKIRAGVDEALKTSTNPSLSNEKKNALATVASHIARANTDVDEQTAVHIALAAGSRNTPIRFIPDPADPTRMRVQVGSAQPVIMGSDAISMLAMVRGGSLRQSGVPSGQPTITNPTRSSTTGQASTQALPGGAGNPAVVTERGGVRATNPVLEEQLKRAARGNTAAQGVPIFDTAPY